MKPTVLIAATAHWFPTARLGMALANAGCMVEAVCPTGHPIGLTSAVRRTHAYRGLAPIESFAAAIAAASPNLIVPSDDVAVGHLHKLYDRERRRGEAGTATCALIERSLGTPASFSVVRKRALFMQLAEEEGVRVPKTEVIATTDDLERCAAQMGFPLVLKSDGSSGGYGVRIVRTYEQAKRAFRKLQAPPLLARAAKRALVNRDTTLVWPSLFRERRRVDKQWTSGMSEPNEGGRMALSSECWARLPPRCASPRDRRGPTVVLVTKARWRSATGRRCSPEAVRCLVRDHLTPYRRLPSD